MKIGIFAGTFDPVHNGHIRYAQEAVKSAGLDKVIIVAEKNPYRKKPFASWDHRQAMIERATEDITEADHDYHFSSKLSHQHTMQDMITVARKHYGTEHELWFLVGSDIFEHMERWQGITHRREYGGFVVALRDDHSEAWLQEKIKSLEQKDFPLNIKLLKNYHPHISSKKIRDRINSDQKPTDIDEAVYRYIMTHQLYSTP